MPGVPSGKGCDACRKQKKKCDQAKPACARCSRLQIPCVGSGEQRYKFKVKVLEVDNAVVNVRKRRARQSPMSLIMSRGRTDMIAGVFISRLEVTDTRYDINCYGSFLQRIPQRIGVNDALDASVDAFTAAFSSIIAKQPPVQALTKYGDALKAVRDCLNDPAKGPTGETLCAIYLIMVIQSWIGPAEPNAPSHAEGLTYLLRATAAKPNHSEFEWEIILCMCVPVIIESIVNPKIKLNPWFSGLLDKISGPIGPKTPNYEKLIELNPDVFPSLSIRSLARLPIFLNDPATHQLDILSAYHMMRIDLQKLRKKMHHVTALDLAIRPGLSYERARHGFTVAYALCLALAMIVNMLIQEFDPLDISLIKESMWCTDEIIRMAEESHHLKPLGSGQVPLCLSVAWAVTKDPRVRAQISVMLAEYREDFQSCDWIKMAMWWRLKFKNVSQKFNAWKLEENGGWDMSPISEMRPVEGECSVQ